jgi:hypothetical protein
VEHAFGPASDTPGHVRALLSDDPEVRADAADSLWGTVNHQGSLYPATRYVVPFLLELLDAPQVHDKDRLLDLLAGIAEGAFPIREFDPGTQQLVDLDPDEVARSDERTHATVREGRDLYLRLLDDEDSETRRSALIVLLCSLRADGSHVTPAVRHRYERESDRILQASLLRCLGGFTPVDAATHKVLVHTWRDAADLLLRVAACAALAHIDGERAPEGVEMELVRALAEPDTVVAEAYWYLVNAGGWNRTDYVEDLALALRAMGPRGTAAALPRLTQALTERCAGTVPEALPFGRTSRWIQPTLAADGSLRSQQYEGRFIDPPTAELHLAEALLLLTFGRRQSAESVRLMPLVPSPEQRLALEAVRACNAIWYYDANMDTLLTERSLPSTREALAAYLANGRV